MNKKCTEAKQKKRSRYGIKWKMYAILIIFLGFSVGIIWFFQVRMLTYFYQSSKFGELEKTSMVISQSLKENGGVSDKMGTIIEEHSSLYAEDIWVCKVTQQGFFTELWAMETDKPIREVIVSNFSLLHNKTVKNEGNYIALISNSYQKGDKLFIIEDNNGRPGTYPFRENGSERLRAVYVTVTDIGNDEYMIVQSTSLTPLAAVKNTIKNQVLWIGVILSIVALIIATFMTKIITKPIEKINGSAKRLAKGEYGADFTVSGYKEIDELADTLSYASCELAKTDKLQKELISNVSHDLRTPLTMIRGYGEVMRDIPGENTPENIQIIIDETTRLSELVNDMLDLSRIQSGTRKTEMQVFSLTATIRDTLQRYERLTMHDGYKIEFFAKEDINVFADRGMILQVVYNLINNAINYTSEDKYVSVRQEIHENIVRVSITDTGEGIAEEELSAIWDRYYKVDKVHKRATVGTGLGLSIVKQVLELHGAKYGVDSKPDKGSTFWFELSVYGADNIDALNNVDYIEADYEKQEDD